MQKLFLFSHKIYEEEKMNQHSYTNGMFYVGYEKKLIITILECEISETL